MRRMISGKAQKYIKDLATNHPDPSADWGGSSYTAGNGIDITDSEISIDDTVVATKTDLEDYELKTDAFSGDYDDLTNKPDLSIYAESSDLATVATTGDYDDLTNKPTIPAAQVQSDWSQSDNTAVDYIKNKPTIPAAVSGTNDGTNWTNLTIGSDTYAIPQGGSGGSYTFTNGLTESSGTVSWDLNDYLNTATDSLDARKALFIGKYPNKTNKNGVIVIGNYGSVTAANIKTIVGKCSGQGISINSHNFASAANTLAGNGIVIGSSNNQTVSSNQTGSIVCGTGLDNQNSGSGNLTLGTYNEYTSNKLLIIGNGTSNNARSNAMTVDTEGVIVSKNLPAVPTTTDGTYVLKATVSSGVVTYA